MKNTDLRTAREGRGWTMDGLAERSGVNKSTISRLENGENTNPSNATVAALERALRLRRGTLVFGDQVNELAS